MLVQHCHTGCADDLECLFSSIAAQKLRVKRKIPSAVPCSVIHQLDQLRIFFQTDRLAEMPDEHIIRAVEQRQQRAPEDTQEHSRKNQHTCPDPDQIFAQHFFSHSGFNLGFDHSPVDDLSSGIRLSAYLLFLWQLFCIQRRNGCFRFLRRLRLHGLHSVIVLFHILSFTAYSSIPSGIS